MAEKRRGYTDEEALAFHRLPQPGKLSMQPTKPMATQRDLVLAYSPGVAVPVRAIAADPDAAYDYTSKGNLVAVISNGTAILGMGDLGAMASKPVMEGKAVLFKRFADVDSIDIEVETRDTDAFVQCVANIGRTFGGINLEDIKAPECFIIEQRLRDMLDVPVFHDDQHGTAIISAAGILNACEITRRRMSDLVVVINGAGAAALSVIGLLQSLGVKSSNTILCDSKGVIYRGREEGMNQWKAPHAADTKARTLEEALKGADCFIGLSVRGAMTQDMVKSMAKKPIIFAMANPDPEITPEEVHAVRSDAIVATGRSDYPNQVNNVLGFPYIFRGALDVRARTINEEMKLAAVRALASLAREDVPDEVAAAYAGTQLKFGPEYLIPTPFDPRLISYVPPFVAEAAAATGVARKPVEDMQAYRHALARRLDPSAGLLQRVQGAVRAAPKTIVFAEGEEPSVIRAAYQFQAQGLGKAILVGRDEVVRENMAVLGVEGDGGLEIWNARLNDRNAEFTDFLYERLKRDGYLRRDVQRMVNNDRNVFSALMVAAGVAQGMVTGTTRSYDVALRDVRMVLDAAPGETPIGLSVVLARGRTLLIADTNIAEFPSPEDLADIACGAARVARHLGLEPRVAFLSYSTFGNPPGERSGKLRQAAALLDQRGVDFEYEGDIAADVALDPEHHNLFPFSRLSEPANVLVMPAIHSASISTKLLGVAGGAQVLGPLLVGLEKPVQICRLGAPVSDIVMMATMAAYDVGGREAINAMAAE
jgi:malate dehydrogenase (oxaloacetate-decarboxylating)(NADP+)